MKSVIVLAFTAAVLFFFLPALLAGPDGGSAGKCPAGGDAKPAGEEPKPGEGEEPKPPEDGEAKPPADGDGGGSAFDEPKEGEGEAKPGEEESKPTPKTFTFKDYKLEMETKDARWWTVNEIPQEEADKGVVLNLQFKLPKSEDYFDVRMFSQGWKVGGKLSFQDGTEIGIDNYKMLCEKYYADDMKEWKEVRDAEPPKKIKMANAVKTAYKYAFTGLGPGNKFPLHKEMYLFKFKDRTYYINILFTTTSIKNERVVKVVDEMMKSLREKPERR